ncbi:hypothetical protein SeMB42_g05815 [Synchytrium endobioticum]|uniref:Mediator of RNA polymerase II transcription subunit 10 n=1 Tax=Synchytrium endobioticum TaxID=286115 RepID=A0A507CN08_9FUNG|nr:hypothetical protein SeLEV6574_g06582 [Synchytrium endobioticum]TPX40910.1 hypothetical protein SeMB42_g05815 [Synchytrium endobioticum]
MRNITGGLPRCYLCLSPRMEHSTMDHRSIPASSANSFSLLKSDSVSALDAKLQEFIELLRRIGMSTADYQVEGKDVYMKRINQIVTSLQDLDQLKETVDIDIPPAVINDFICHGLNPDTFTAKQIRLFTDVNQKSYGRIRQLQLLKSEVEKEIMPNFPVLYEQLKKTLSSGNSSSSNGPSVVFSGGEHS